jgi:hypothetical protein
LAVTVGYVTVEHCQSVGNAQKQMPEPERVQRRLSPGAAGDEVQRRNNIKKMKIGSILGAETVREVRRNGKKRTFDAPWCT